MKLNCLVVDDEPLASDQMERYVLRTPFLELAGKYNNASDALEKINQSTIHLVFLDIQMPDLNGIQLSKLIPETCKIIFTTAFQEFAIEGYKVSALDYLLKPISYDEFLQASLRAKDWFEKIPEPSGDPWIFVKSEYKQVKILVNEIMYVEGLKDYVKIWIRGQVHPVVTRMSLKSLESALPGNRFLRIHRSYIVALDHIQGIERSAVIMANKTAISVADAYKEKFNEFVSSRSVG